MFEVMMCTYSDRVHHCSWYSPYSYHTAVPQFCVVVPPCTTTILMCLLPLHSGSAIGGTDSSSFAFILRENLCESSTPLIRGIHFSDLLVCCVRCYSIPISADEYALCLLLSLAIMFVLLSRCLVEAPVHCHGSGCHPTQTVSRQILPPSYLYGRAFAFHVAPP